MSLNKEQILAADDTKPVKVSVPEWGGDVWVSPLRGSQRGEVTGLEGDALFAKLIIATLVDENGVSLGFTEEDIPALREKCLPALVRIFQTALNLNGISRAAVEEARGN